MCSQLKNTLLLQKQNKKQKKNKKKNPNHHLSLQQAVVFAIGTSKTTDDHSKYSNTLKA